MTPQTLNYRNHVAAYQRQTVITLSPGQIVKRLYDLGIQGCNERDTDKVSKVLTELMTGLNFDYKEVALGLYQLYSYCLNKVKSCKYREVANVLKGLSEAWGTALKNMGAES